MKYMNQPITNGRIPVCLLAPSYNWRANTPPFTASGQVVHSTFTWHLANPLWLPPNVPISIEIGHQNDFAVASPADSQTVDVTVRGVADDSGVEPEYIDIPYASAFLGAVQSTVTAGRPASPTMPELTAQTDLFNPFTVPLSVDRFQYEISLVAQNGRGGRRGERELRPPMPLRRKIRRRSSPRRELRSRRRYVQRSSLVAQAELIRDFLAIGAVIPRPRGRGETKTVLDPGHYYIASLRKCRSSSIAGPWLPDAGGARCVKSQAHGGRGANPYWR
jgi:hypothetical protein